MCETLTLGCKFLSDVSAVNSPIVVELLVITALTTRLQNPYRMLAAKKPSQINTNMTPHNIKAKRHNYTLRNIQTKLTQKKQSSPKQTKEKRRSSYTSQTTTQKYTASSLKTTITLSRKTPLPNTNNSLPQH